MSDVAVGTADGAEVPGGHSESIYRRLKRRARRFVQRNSVAFYAFILAFILALILLTPRMLVNIQAGHVGVLWLRFFGGTVTDRYYGEGIHMIFPWDEMYIYDARLQNSARIYDTISSNGLAMQVEIATRYRINREAVGLLHKLVGPNYEDILVSPEIGSHARELISRYTPEQLYSETRGFIQAQILERMVTQLGSSLVNQSVQGKLVNVEDVLIRSVTLPPRVQEAIQRKAEQYQAMLEYDFRIAREEKERERKRIEAEGVRDFQSIVAKSITDEYLRLRGIEATMALANSRNSKIIIIGGKDGLPVILNTGDAASAPENQTEMPGSEEAAVLSNAQNARPTDVTSPNAATSIMNEQQGPQATTPGAGPASPTGPISGTGTPPTMPTSTPTGAPAPATSSPSPEAGTSPDLTTQPAGQAAPGATRKESGSQPVKKESGDQPVKREGGDTSSSSSLTGKLMNFLKKE